MITLLSNTELPEGFSYPDDFLRIATRQKLIDFDPWIVLEGDQLQMRYIGINQRFPNKNIIPFARREDNDDVACWLLGDTESVYIIHDFSTQGYEKKKKLSFWNWLRQALEDTINYNGD